MNKQNRPNTKAILDGLKDFQRDTVEYVFRRMYLDDDRAYRFLVADEVGLGKTLVARGLIAKTIDHLWNEDRRIDIIYVCSNAEIARQNIARLNVLGEQKFSFATRLTLLALKLKELQKQKINFVSFTPTTSFEMSSTGWSLERELLFHLLNNHLENGNVKKMTQVLSANAGLDQFRYRVNSFPDRHTSPHPKIQYNFHRRLDKNPQVLQKFVDLCDQMPRSGAKIPDELNRDRNTLIGELRTYLAEAGLEWLEPDLVILDEFQRFKDLLGGELDEPSGAAELAHQLFSYREDKSNPDTQARVLLLSATPYKMYTMHQERETDNHYSDFQSTLRFLMPKTEQVDSVAASIQDYRERLWSIGVDNGAGVFAAKLTLEEKLRSVMTRTERLASSADRSGMLVESDRMQASLAQSDVEHFMALKELTEVVESNDLLSFWKSAPYLLNFMDDYDFKRRILTEIESGEQSLDFVRAFNSAKPTLIEATDVERYAKLDPSNAQLRGLQQEAVDRGAWRLLWIPPSRPYYQAGGAFASSVAADLTKTLIFSSWKVVPKVVASLLSYEAERSMFVSYQRKSANTAEARGRRGRLLQFDIGRSGPRGMPVFALIYPCRYLAEVFDPACKSHTQELNREPGKVSDLINTIASLLELELAPHLALASQNAGDEDRAWFWAAPLLLDRSHHSDHLAQWLSQEHIKVRASSSDQNPETENKGWLAHVETARRFVSNGIELGKPPRNLCKILAAMAIAAPGNCALRGLSRMDLTRGSSSISLSNAAMSVAEGFVHLFNLPEAIAMIRGQKRERTARINRRPIPYWQSVLRYCVQGNVQAVIDEYLHVLCDSPGADTRSTDDGVETCDPCETIAKQIVEAITLRTSSVKADTYRVTRRKVSMSEPIRFRTRFAMAFGDQRNEDDTEGSRKEHVRDAFNSPFWPFVLVSTSVGQEGLDFHRYCHSIMHWNLPSNPVDLEQREGRIHRYKSHALRKNIAWKFGELNHEKHHDLWQKMFDAALNDRKTGQNEMYPFWISDEGPAKIERHVPTLPLSREKAHKRNLMRSLTVYRMVFGQNRQEDMVQFLLGQVDPQLMEEVSKRCHINLSPPEMTLENNSV